MGSSTLTKHPLVEPAGGQSYHPSVERGRDPSPDNSQNFSSGLALTLPVQT